MFLLCFQNPLPWRKSWEKLVYRLILFFSITEIFSKRRKIYSRMKENQSYANVGFVIEKMYDKQAAFLLWFLANSMSMRESNALFIMVILSRNFWLGIMNGSRLQDLQWIFVNPLEFGWFSLTFIRTRIDYSLHYFDYYRLRTLFFLFEQEPHESILKFGCISPNMKNRRAISARLGTRAHGREINSLMRKQLNKQVSSENVSFWEGQKAFPSIQPNKRQRFKWPMIHFSKHT